MNSPDLEERQRRAIKALLWFALALYFGSVAIVINAIVFIGSWADFSMRRIMITSALLNLISFFYILYKWYDGLRNIHK